MCVCVGVGGRQGASLFGGHVGVGFCERVLLVRVIPPEPQGRDTGPARTRCQNAGTWLPGENG